MSDETPSIGSEPAPATVPPAGEVPGPRPPSDPATPAPPTAQSLPPPAPATPPPAPAPAAAPAPAPATPVTSPPAKGAPAAAEAEQAPTSSATEEAPAPPPAGASEEAPATEAPGAGETEEEGAAAPQRRRLRLVGTLAFAAIVLVLLGAIGYVLYQRLYGDPTRDAMAGDCLADLPVVAEGEDQEVSTARMVTCDDPAATFVVEGRLDSLSEAQASATEICQAYEQARFIYRVVPRGGTGYVLCLRQVGE